MQGYYKIRRVILGILSTKLPKGLYYHGAHHTLDVLRVCNQYIIRENFDDHASKILRLAALLHDIGFTISMDDHEFHGAEIAEKLMNEYHFAKGDIEEVKGLIMVTKIPHRPNNLLEEIICDADLDYLGRDDFYTISDQLFRELKFNSLISNKLEWDEMQIRFLEAHQFHTNFAKKNRQPNKEKRISELKLSLQ